MTNLTQECVEEQALYEISDVYLTWSAIGTVHRFRDLNPGPHGARGTAYSSSTNGERKSYSSGMFDVVPRSGKWSYFFFS